MAQEDFTWSDEEKNVCTNEAQLAMLNRLVEFVNTRLAEIKQLETDMATAKSDIEDLKNPPK